MTECRRKVKEGEGRKYKDSERGTVKEGKKGIEGSTVREDEGKEGEEMMNKRKEVHGRNGNEEESPRKG